MAASGILEPNEVRKPSVYGPVEAAETGHWLYTAWLIRYILILRTVGTRFLTEQEEFTERIVKRERAVVFGGWRNKYRCLYMCVCIKVHTCTYSLALSTKKAWKQQNSNSNEYPCAKILVSKYHSLGKATRDP